MRIHQSVRTVLLACVLAIGAVGCNALSCNSKPTATRVVTPVETEDPLTAVRDTIRKVHDLEACKALVHQLNAHLRNTSGTVPTLAADERSIIEKELGLTGEELREITDAEYSTLDANYLFQCLLIHDGLSALGLNWADTEAARLERIRAGFAWAMRQIWLTPQEGRPAPASYILKRGYGGEPERAAVILAVFHQLGFDACLIGEERGDGVRMWGVGVGLGSDILLFDPRRGQALLGPDGKIVTLKQVRANPELIKPIEIQREKTDLPTLVKASKVFLVPPLSALAPRAQFMEQTLSFQPPLRIAQSASSARRRLETTGETPRFWNPKNDHSTPVRNLAYFLPVDEGGFDRTPRGSCLLDQFRNRLAPQSFMPPLIAEESIAGDPGRRLRVAFTGRFVAVFDVANQPRDLVLRGQYDEATKGLVEYLKQINLSQERIAQEQNLDEESEKWVQQMRTVAAQFERAQIRPGEVDPAAAKYQVDEMLKNALKINLYIERAAAEPFGIHVTFQLALCKHEQALQLARQSQNAADADILREAWQSAASWWTTFLNKYGAVPYLPKGMTAHVNALLAEAKAGTAVPSAK